MVQTQNHPILHIQNDWMDPNDRSIFAHEDLAWAEILLDAFYPHHRMDWAT
jgi:hypothetical protein